MTDFTPEARIGVPQTATTAAKAVSASITLVGTYAAIVVSILSDGDVTSGDVGALVSGALGMIAAVARVWATKNERKSPR